MWADSRSTYRPRTQSWSAGWIVIAVLCGVAIGFGLPSEPFHALAPGKPAQPSTDSARHYAKPVDAATPKPDPRQIQSALPPPAGRTEQPAELPLPPASRQVYLCKSYAGAAFWSSATCSTQRATIDRIVTVPGHFSWEQGVAMAQQQRRDAEGLYAAPKVATTAGAIAREASSSSGECAALDARRTK